MKGDLKQEKNILAQKLGNKNVHNKGNTYSQTYTPIDGMGYNKLQNVLEKEVGVG